VVADISAQLDAFGQFEDQQQRIESLQSRIQAGRALIKSLSERVDAVSARVEGWERADREWQEKTRKRLKAVWVVTLVIFLLVLSLFVGSQYVPESLESTTARIASDGLRGAAGPNTDTRIGPGDSGAPGKSRPLNDTEPPGLPLPSDTADMLRAFDEL
jgi:cell division protein FtsB